MLRIPTSAPHIPSLPLNSIRVLWSVMIPVYNCSKYLPMVLESVLMQDLGADQMQIEVVDDASTDANVEELVQKTGRGRITYFRQPQNVGSLRNFETCINRSRGQLVHLLHGDDNIKPGFYVKMGRLLETYSEAGAAFCRNSFINESGKTTLISKEESATDCLLENWLIRSGERQRNQYVSTVVRREVYERLGSFYGMTYGEDWEMWVRIAKVYPIAYTPEVLSEYRGHVGSISSSKVFNFQLAKDLQTAVSLISNHIPEDQRANVSRKSRSHCARFIIGTANAIWNSSRSLTMINKQMKQEVKSKLNREKFYSAISSEDLNKVDDQLKSLEEILIEEKEGFTGALLMKKAGLVKNVKSKLKLFKEGHHKLEEAIEKDNSNIEYRFLRLIIQENAPDILNYNKDIKKDSAFIKENYKNLPVVVRDAIEDYSKKSKVLKLN